MARCVPFRKMSVGDLARWSTGYVLDNILFPVDTLVWTRCAGRRIDEETRQKIMEPKPRTQLLKGIPTIYIDLGLWVPWVDLLMSSLQLIPLAADAKAKARWFSYHLFGRQLPHLVFFRAGQDFCSTFRDVDGPIRSVLVWAG